MKPIHYALGDAGDAVRDIQRKLASLDPQGYPDLIRLQAEPCSGMYDAATAAAVRAFKQQQAIEPLDGTCDEPTWRRLDEQAGSVFAETWQFEIDALRGDLPEQVEPVRDALLQQAHAHQLAGLAFSGGGIRSATFNLGVLQALAELRMLRDFDYLSTVSGGGYIGAWLSKWLKRLDGNIVDIERQLTPGSRETAVKREPEEIKFLRQYTNYLTPKTGFFSADTWALLATYTRNTVLNLSILVALMAAVLIVPRLLALVVERASAHPPRYLADAYAALGFSGFAAAAVLAALWSVFWIAASISTRPDPADPRHLRGQSQASIIGFVIVPLMLAAFCASAALWEQHGAISAAWDAWFAQPGLHNPIVAWLVAPGVAYFVAWCAGWSWAQLHNRRAERRARKAPAPLDWRELRIEGAGHLACAVAALAVGALLVIMATAALHDWHQALGPAAPDTTIPVVAFGMPILLALFGVTMVLSVGLVGSLYTDRSREWWSRQGGWTAIFAIAWLALVAVSLYAPAAVGWFHGHFGGWASAALNSAWLGLTVAGLMLGKRSTPAAPPAQAQAQAALLARAAPLVFSVGALCLVSTLLHALLLPHGFHTRAAADASLAGYAAEYYRQALLADFARLLLPMAGLALAGLVLAWRVDINKFSLHMMYRNRLVRAYLGASNSARQPHPFTGFDPADEVHLDELLATNATLQRPYHILNTALNLVNGAELAWQARKAAGFTFSPAFCGFELPGTASPGGARLAHEALRGSFRRTSAYRAPSPTRHDEECGINLGMAMAVSGAAASPSMGYHSSPPLAFLMTLFNVRLGRWFANPLRPLPRHDGNAVRAARPPRTSPRLGLWYLVKELFGLTDASASYVYLSDGGHFDNLGVYELVRRRCRLIVVVDAGADGQFDFEDLGNAIRKCGTDLHVEIEIDVGKIDLLKPAEFSRSHCVTGAIRYDKVDQNAPAGTLLYIKPSLLGTEFADVLNYRKTNRSFPHESTVDQWFDETQFETYRSLGYSIGKRALTRAAATASRNELERHNIGALCDALHTCWDDPDRARERDGARQGLHVVTDRRALQRRLTDADAAA
ncbi:MAG: peptidoglycan-binding protein, partial [Pseudomonadota bacterium]|nr:peptidoglycan-binding protein [Pseudomonadota bacterium]